MNPKELKENFTNQFSGVIDEINSLENQLTAKKEMALKLKGALEALEILDKQEEETISEVLKE